MIISLISGCYVKDDESLQNLKLSSILELPYTSKASKFEAEMWNPFKLTSRKNNSEVDLEIHNLVYDVDKVEAPSIHFKHYSHRTHNGKWRLIVPFKKSLKMNSVYYPDFYMDVAEKIGLDMKSEDFDANCKNHTRFFFLPQQSTPIIENHGDLFEYTTPRMGNKDSSNRYYKPYYPSIDDHLIEKMEKLNVAFLNIACFQDLNRREGCWLHETHSGSLDINHDPPSIYCHHSTCHKRNIEELEKILRKPLDKLSRTSAYLLIGLHRKIWDWNFIENLYLPSHLKNKHHLLLRLKFVSVYDVDTILALLFEHKIVYVQNEGMFYIFDGMKYVGRTELELSSIILEKLSKYYCYCGKDKKGEDMAKEIKQILATLRSREMGKIKATPAIHLENGIIEILEKEGSFVFHKEAGSYFNKKVLNYSYDPTATCPKWIADMNDRFDGDNRVLALQEFMGYCCSPMRKFESMIFLFGLLRAGKNTIADLIRSMVGGEVGTMGDLMNPDRRSVFCDERTVFVDEGFKGASDEILSTLKMLTAKDTPVSCRYLHKHPFSAPTFPKLIFAFNQTPTDFKIDSALSARIVAINFTKTYLGVENRDLLSEYRAELPGILNWALEGWIRLNKQNYFTKTESSKVDLIESTKTEGEMAVDDFLRKLAPGNYRAKDLFDTFSKSVELYSLGVSIRTFGEIAKEHLRYYRANDGIYYKKGDPVIRYVPMSELEAEVETTIGDSL